MASVVAAGAGEGTSGGGGGGGGGGGEAAAVGIDWRQRGMAPSTGLGTHSRWHSGTHRKTTSAGTALPGSLPAMGGEGGTVKGVWRWEGVRILVKEFRWSPPVKGVTVTRSEERESEGGGGGEGGEGGKGGEGGGE